MKERSVTDFKVGDNIYYAYDCHHSFDSASLPSIREGKVVAIHTMKNRPPCVEVELMDAEISSGKMKYIIEEKEVSDGKLSKRYDIIVDFLRHFIKVEIEVTRKRFDEIQKSLEWKITVQESIEELGHNVSPIS